MVALHQRYPTRIKVELFQPGKRLQQLELIVEIVFEPEHHFVRFPWRGGVARRDA